MPLRVSFDDFPTLGKKVNGKRLVYLDNAATTLKPKPVLEKMVDFYISSYSNVHRAVHTLASRATVAYEEARMKVAKFLNADPSEVIFTSGATMGINLVVNSLLRSGILKEGDVVLLSQAEHHANLVPWIRLSKFHGFGIAYIEVNEKGVLTEEAILRGKEYKPKIVSVTGHSNVTGQVIPLEFVREVFEDAILVVDGAQLVPHKRLDVKDLGLDFLVFSGHKMLGPTGVGVLYGRKDLLEVMEPFLYGGEMIDKVSFEEVTFNEIPYKFEAGTQNIAGVVGLGYALDYLEALGFDSLEEHVRDLTEYLIEELSKLEFVELYGPLDHSHVSIVSFNVEGIHPHDVAHVLDQEFGVAVRSGHHCAQPLVRALARGTKLSNFPNSTVRASVYLYNTKEDVDVMVEGLKKLKGWFG